MLSPGKARGVENLNSRQDGRRSHKREKQRTIYSLDHAPDQTYIRLQQLHCLFDLATSPPFWVIAWIGTIFMEFRGPKALVNLHGSPQTRSNSIPSCLSVIACSRWLIFGYDSYSRVGGCTA
jgi:hypothetical protein